MPAARNPEDRECGREGDTSQPWKGALVLVRRTPYFEARVQLEAADAGSITRQDECSLSKSTLALGQSCNATGLLHRGGDLNEPGVRVESHPICLWAEGSDTILRPGSVVQGSSHYALWSLRGMSSSKGLPRMGISLLPSTDVVLGSTRGEERLSFAPGVLVTMRSLSSRPRTYVCSLAGNWLTDRATRG